VGPGSASLRLQAAEKSELERGQGGAAAAAAELARLEAEVARGLEAPPVSSTDFIDGPPKGSASHARSLSLDKAAQEPHEQTGGVWGNGGRAALMNGTNGFEWMNGG